MNAEGLRDLPDALLKHAAAMDRHAIVMQQSSKDVKDGLRESSIVLGACVVIWVVVGLFRSSKP